MLFFILSVNELNNQSITRSGYTISCALIGSRKPKHCLDRERTKAEGNGERTEIHVGGDVA